MNQPNSPAIVPPGWQGRVRIAWYLTALAALMMVAASLPGYRGGFVSEAGRIIHLTPAWIRFFAFSQAAASLACVAICLLLSALLFHRKSVEVSAITISFYLLFYGIVLGGPLEAIIMYWSLPYRIAILLQTILITVPTIVLLATFPNGRFVPSWSRWPIALALPINLLILASPDEDWIALTTPVAGGSVLGLVAVIVAAIAAQAIRYRKYSTVVERRQTRWVLVGIIAWFVYIGIMSVPWQITQQIPSGEPLPWWQPIAGVTWWLSLSILPVSLTISILRHSLYDIDLLIRRTLVYSILTASLAGVYLGTVVILQAAFVPFAVQQSDIAIVISTLAIASLFNPLRRRIQDFIDRRFYRERYDAERTLVRFAAEARDEVDVEKLGRALIATLRETIRPEKTSLWLTVEEADRNKE
ncbi:MAG TPA: hypothetical protein VMN57_14770 [Anaerolineales bacterium]|nr:hypothetical protein [Anaerolineales bacterium]